MTDLFPNDPVIGWQEAEYEKGGEVRIDLRRRCDDDDAGVRGWIVFDPLPRRPGIGTALEGGVLR